MKVKEMISRLDDSGWRLVRTKGSYRQFQHPEKAHLGTITVAGQPSLDMPKGTANAILKQARLKE